MFPVAITDQQLQAIATSMWHRDDSLSRLVRVLQQIRAIQLDELLLEIKSDLRSEQIVQQIQTLDYEICFLIQLTLHENAVLGRSREIGNHKIEPEAKL